MQKKYGAVYVVMRLFYCLNPKIERIIIDRVQGRAAHLLYSRYGLERLGRIIETLILIKGKKGSPIINTPLHLLEYSPELIKFLIKERRRVADLILEQPQK